MKIDIFNAEDTGKKYGIIYTDPPWKQIRGGKKTVRPNTSGKSVPYETMDLPEIMEIHRHVLTQLAAENHNVFMWTIDKHLIDAQRIMELLGYRLHARLIWDKGNGPAPAYTVRFTHEYLLWFYKKGQMILPDTSMRGVYTTVIREPSRRRHSQKPDRAYEMMEALFPGQNRLELFARHERPGWDCWGDEV